MAKRKSWQEISKEPEQIQKRRVKDAARSAAYKQEQLEKGMLARNTALNKMGYDGTGYVEIYKTETQAARLQYYCGVEPTPAPIKTIDASVDPPAIIDYPELPGSDDAQDTNAIMMFEAAHKPREPSAAHYCITTRMRRARAILGKAIGRIVPQCQVQQ